MEKSFENYEKACVEAVRAVSNIPVRYNSKAAQEKLLACAEDLLEFVKSKYPGEELYCPYMKALDEACSNMKNKEE